MSKVEGHIKVPGPVFRPAQVTSDNVFLFSMQSENAYTCHCASVAGTSLGPPGNINATATTQRGCWKS